MNIGRYRVIDSGRLPGLALGLVMLLAAAVAAAQAQPEFLQGGYLDRAQTQSTDNVSVTAAVPGADESTELFDLDLYARGVQPVWLEITNHTGTPISFLPVGLDPSYFTAAEVANRGAKEGESRDVMREQLMFRAGMDMRVQPGQTRSGFIYSLLDEGTKAFNVDVKGPELFETFTFFIPVPGLRVDHYNVDWENIYPPDEVFDLSTAELIEWLEAQVCCTTDKDAEGSGDPLNLVVIGGLKDVYVAFMRSGWDETETITTGTSWKTVKSFIGGGEYRYSPVSGLYVFGRPQDVAFQKARGNIHERNHLRLWLAPVRYQGALVWLGQISRDIGVHFTRKTITTHKIDPNVDETREYLLENLAYAQGLERIAYVNGVGEVSMDEPAGNLTGDPWFSDGQRVVLWVTSQPVELDDVAFEIWRQPKR